MCAILLFADSMTVNESEMIEKVMDICGMKGI